MKTAIHNPYLDSLGGGERYTLAFAKVMSALGSRVSIEWKDPSIKERLEKRFGMDLAGIEFVPDIRRGDGCDVCFWLSDGSVPTLLARKNILHFQVPFHGVGGRSLLNRMKLARINKVVCNSFFTKSFIDKEYGVNSAVVYPPIQVDQIKSKRKEDLILFVGRFSALKQSKRQDVLIKAFQKFTSGKNKSWKLGLAGGVEIGAGRLLKKLKESVKGYRIEIIESPDFETLKDLYGKAHIFWSASGYGEDETLSPEKVEHFGMTVVEAMAAGAIPIIFNSGGHKETVENGVNGFLWKKIPELISITEKLVKKSGDFSRISKEAKKKSAEFSFERFKIEITNLVK